MAKKEELEKPKEFKLNHDWGLMQRLFNFQSENIHIPKSKKAYGYYYADLDSIIEIITPYLQKHGIGYFHQTTQVADSEQSRLRTILFNPDKSEDIVSCENFIDEDVKLSGMNKFMVLGSAITYFRRYHIVTMLGLTTDEDTDVGGKEKTESNSKSSTTTSKKPGKSIESAKEESSVDYVKIFDNLISKGKPVDQLNKMFDKYKKNMTPETMTTIKDKISKVK